MSRRVVAADRLRSAFSCASFAAILALLVPQGSAAATLNVQNNGVDSATCGKDANPCRSISQAIANASNGDKIVVGPGTYGDLNGDGVLGNSPGEESGSGCMVCITKSVTVVSSDGASETIIDARDVPNLSENVAIVANNVKFGASGQGFTVTNVLTSPDAESPTGGISTIADQVIIRGNRVVVERSQSTLFSGISAGTFPVNGNTVLIEGNQVIGWVQGIAGEGVNMTVSQNTVQLNYRGIAIGPGTAKGNVATGNGNGIVTYQNSATVKGNAVLGNGVGIDASGGGTIEDNNIFGNGCGLDINGFPAPASVPATNNYWGAATGPGPAPANDVCGAEANVAIVAPFATQPFTVTLKVIP